MTRIRHYTSEDRLAVARLNDTYYRDTHGFDATFTEALNTALDRIEPSIQARSGTGWVVEHAAQIAGSLFLTPEDQTTGRIRLFILHPSLQGAGLGRKLLTTAIKAAPSLGFTAVRVSTFTIHTAACALYDASGFREEAPTECHVFGRALQQVDYLLQTPVQDLL